MVGALLLGLVAGFLARAIVPNDAFEELSGPKSWLVSVVLGLVGALVGYAIFNRALGIGDDDIFDWGGIVGAVIGSIIALLIAGWALERWGHRGRGSRVA
jgi:uncharacterized membrane protein YeaQ/YmgE (transglycosylase-associated protein family)